MLSPASLRLCCLAVMAPALTKAVKQTDCLPVVFSKTYTKSKENNLNDKSTINGSTLAKEPGKSLINSFKSKSYMHNNIRTFLKYGYSKTRLLVCRSANQNNAVLKSKVWHGTKLFTVPDKIRQKHTMSKHNNSLRNMCLAKAKTSNVQNHKDQMHKLVQEPLTNNKSDSTPAILSPLTEMLPQESIVDSLISQDKPVSVANMTGLLANSPDLEASSNINDLTLKLDRKLNEATTSFNAVISPNVSITAKSEVDNKPPFSQTNISHISNGNVTFSTSTNSCNLNHPETISSSNSDNLPCTTTVCHSSVTSINFASNDKSNLSLILEDVKEVMAELIKNVSSLLSKETIHPLPDFPETIRISKKDFSKLSLLNCNICTDKAIENNVFKKKKLEIQDQLPFLSTPRIYNSHMSQISFGVLKSRILLLLEKIIMLRKQLQYQNLKEMNVYVSEQLHSFVSHYQNQFSITCQNPLPSTSTKKNKESIDLKTELLQSENVRNLSTAALVNFVRELETTGSADKYLPQQNSQSNDLSGDKTITFNPEDCAKIKLISRQLLADIKPLLSYVDPELTESSSDEDDDVEISCEISDQEQENLSVQKSALWRWERDRAAIARRWTWLVMQNHEVMYRRMQIKKIAKQLRIAKGEVCFDEKTICKRSLSNDLDDACLQSPSKQATLKCIIKPVNGYLDHSCLNDNKHSVNPSQPSSAEAAQEKIHCNQSLTPFSSDDFCSRTQPLKMSSFRKRKLLRTSGLHLTNNKAARLSTVSCCCNCQNMMHSCVLCGGRYNNVQSVDPDTMPLLERIALLDPSFHPVLSFEKDILQSLHLENISKKKEVRLQALVEIPTVEKKHPNLVMSKIKHLSEIRHFKQMKLSKYRSLFNPRYRNKHLHRNKHLRNRGLIFGKWRRYQNSLHIRDRIRRSSFVSNASSKDSPVHSPSSLIDENFGPDQMKKRRDDLQFDIDDVILPCNAKILRSESLQYKDIEIPSWRYKEVDFTSPLDEDDDDTEDISDSKYAERYAKLEKEEKKMGRGMTSGLNRRGRKMQRSDSHADYSNEATTPIPMMLYQQDIVFQDPHSIITNEPTSPTLSPPATPLSFATISDDSQLSVGNGINSRNEKRKIIVSKRPSEENSRISLVEHDDVQPYTKLIYPLSDKDYEEMLKQSPHLNEEPDIIVPDNKKFSPVSPYSSSSTSTVEEENEDMTDPEWTVIRQESGERVCMRFAKR